MDRNFIDDLNTAVFTTRYILEDGKPILYIYHYTEDGAWQFDGDEDCVESDYRITSLEEMIGIDNTILDVSSLPLGYYAYRNSKAEAWNKHPI